MGCSNCSTGNGAAPGCKQNGGCSSGGCNRMNTFQWLNDDIYFDNDAFNIIEISFKNGIRKGFFRNSQKLNLEKGMLVVVESSAGIGYDIGSVSLMGEMVKWQMKKRKVKEDSDLIKNILRVAKDTEVQTMDVVRAKEPSDMIRARAIAKQLNLDMKVADIEYQADGKKCTYYYIANGRVDFRELIKVYASEFKVKVEMRQIGIRQEAALVGGIGVCGRELCCSTWLTDFKSVNTTIARYQQLAINQQKLSGQCGRLKCCLNYELDTYVDALQHFPKADKITTQKGELVLVKTDVFGRKMHYYDKSTYKFLIFTIEEVNALLKNIKQGIIPEGGAVLLEQKSTIKKEKEFVDNTGELTLKNLEKTAKKRKDREKKERTNPQEKNNKPNPNQEVKNPEHKKPNKPPHFQKQKPNNDPPKS